ncbi:CoB--CoM heterodisulfide reductase iron-sulfur subunit A family protein [candidate division KSB1 bacterium]|nr:CoB--CoM heterodisulfide reductase iron-sulfur subunit A family protein [candidate division KSB1 bacterium]
MMDAGRHPNIEIFINSELTALSGKAGKFKATIRKHPTFVDEALCTGCGDCAANCPKVVPNEFDCGLASRKAIFRPFPQAVPNVYVRDEGTCINRPGKPIRCHHCERACQQRAINYDMPPLDIDLSVGSVIVAIGADVFDPYDMKSYGYSTAANIVTGLEFERLLNASGPTGGKILRPSDKKTPKTIAFVQCVGVRGEYEHDYCSRFCCMNSIKDALLVKEHAPDVDKITIFYSDLRCFGKGYETLYERSRQRSEINYFRGKPSKIIEDPSTNDLFIYVENTLTGRPERIKADLVVLASAAVPHAASKQLADALGVDLNEAGFFASKNGTADVLSSTREGVFLCGCSHGPEDIPDSVAQGSGAAALSEHFILDSRLEVEEEEIPQVPTDGPPRIGVFLCHCGINIAGVLNIEQMHEYVKTLPGVVHVENDLFLCADAGQKNIQRMIVEKRLNRIVAAACTPRTHEPIFQETCARVGLNPYLFEMANVRDQCSWVHSHEPELATRRAMDQIRMAVSRAHWLQPLQQQSLPVERTALVIGGGISGIQSALNLAAQNIRTYLIEKDSRVGGRLNSLGTTLPENYPASVLLKEKREQLENSSVEVLLNTSVTKVDGFVGNFEVTTTNGTLKIGSIILALGADTYIPKNEFGYGKLKNVITNFELEQRLSKHPDEIVINGKAAKRVAFIQCVGSRDPETNPHCSRICCGTTIKQAIQLKKQNADVVVFFRDMRTVGHGAEEMYREARGMGILFFRFPDDRKPKVKKDGDACKVIAFDTMLGEEIEIQVDAVVLAAGIIPREKEMEAYREMLKTPRSPDGFLMERHPKLGPVETVVEGVFIAGCVQSPKGIGDSVAQAEAAAAKAAMILSRDTIEISPTTCEVNESLCRGCGLCVRICDFHAPELVQISTGVSVARINQAMCKGCGTCAAWCPTDAIIARHFTDNQIEAMMDTMLKEVA